MRIPSIVLTALAVTVAFVFGRAGVAPPAVAQTQSFSHFECYQAQVRTPSKFVVGLKDQFGGSKAEIYEADLFCTPVVKSLLDRKPLPVPGPADHLLCYHAVGAQPANQVRAIANQLEKNVVKVLAPRYLCVPTHKFERKM